MDWIACPGCGTRYLPTDPACPSCARVLPVAHLHALAAEQSRMRPRRDLLLFTVHLAFAASLTWAVAFWRVPRWFLSLALLELAVAVGALARWRVESGLIHVRACVYGTIASALVFLAIGGPLLVTMLLFNTLVVWWFGRGAIARGRSGNVPAVGEGGGLLWSLTSYLARGGGTETLLPAGLTWCLLIAWLGGLVR